MTLTQLMEVTDANVAGNVHGGVVMRLADTAAALAAIRHAEGLCVTVSVDEISFLEPVHVGDVVTLQSLGQRRRDHLPRVRGPGRGREPDRRAARVHAATAYFVFVALDDDGRPRPVPPIAVETEIERRRQHAAKLRRAARMQHKEALPRTTPPHRRSRLTGRRRPRGRMDATTP